MASIGQDRVKRPKSRDLDEAPEALPVSARCGWMPPDEGIAWTSEGPTRRRQGRAGSALPSRRPSCTSRPVRDAAPRSPCTSRTPCIGCSNGNASCLPGDAPWPQAGTGRHCSAHCMVSWCGKGRNGPGATRPWAGGGGAMWPRNSTSRIVRTGGSTCLPLLFHTAANGSPLTIYTFPLYSLPREVGFVKASGRINFKARDRGLRSS